MFLLAMTEIIILKVPYNAHFQVDSFILGVL